MKISIIIPCYNVSLYIGKCLDNILNQTLTDIEIICVDDKSTDNTVAIIEEYVNKDDRIKLIAKDKNEGAGPSRNRGMDMATGDYICFMDPDDYYPENTTLEKLYSAVTSNNVKIAGGNVRAIDPDGKIVKVLEKFPHTSLCQYSENPFHYGFWRFIYKRNFLISNKIYFPAYLRYQDPPFFVKAMALAEKYYIIEDDVYVYNVNYKTINWTERKALDVLKGVFDVLQICSEYKLNKLYIHQIKDFWEADISDICKQMSSFKSIQDIITNILQNADNQILSQNLDKKLSYQKHFFDIIKKDKKLHKLWKKYIKMPSLWDKIYRKEKGDNGRRRIYLFNIKILAYRKK